MTYTTLEANLKGEQLFLELLHHYIPQIPFEIPKNPFIVSVGCGGSYETEVVQKYFNGRILGIDNNLEEIAYAQEHNSNKHASFKFGDAKSLRKIIYEPVDIIFARHPTIMEKQWSTILRQCYKATKIPGMLFSTTYIRGEHQKLIKRVNKAGYKIIAAEENPLVEVDDHGIFTSCPDLGIVLAIKKKSIFSR